MTTPTPPPAPTVPGNGFGITALALALIGLVLGLVPFTGFIMLILGILAVLLGLLGWSRARNGIATNATMAGLGTVFGVCTIVLGMWSLVVTFNAANQFGRDLQGIGNQQSDFAPTFTAPSPTYSSPTYSSAPAPLPEPSDFTIDIKVLRKACFGSYGCNITYQIDPTYIGTTPLTGRTFTVIYEVTGSEYGTQIKNFEVNSDGTASLAGPDLTRTSSSGATLKAKVTSVSED
jgi:hypothetical protein